MLLTITFKGKNTTDLGYLLYKNPYRPQMFELNHCNAYVFYPEATDERTTVALLLDIDPIDLARGKVGSKGGGLFDYVNDRPYVSSSFMSTAIARVFGTAMTGRADDHQVLSDSKIDLTATIISLPCKDKHEKLNSIFEPLGYKVEYEPLSYEVKYEQLTPDDASVSDEASENNENSTYVNLTISGKVRLRDLLKHLYVLIPVFDRQKHYWVGSDEVEKLLRHGEEWLNDHPEKAFITGRYLNRRRSLINMTYAKLAEATAETADEVAETAETETADETANDNTQEKAEKRQNLNTERIGTVIALLKSRGVKRVIDIGCGEGQLLSHLMKESQFTTITGVDVSHVALEKANRKLKLERAGDYVRERVQLFQGSLLYKDKRFEGYDAICIIEVIEHLDIPRLTAFERVIFEFAKPPLVVLTTPNREYNEKYEHLTESMLRHSDHRFEYTCAEFTDWGNKISEKYGYTAWTTGIGEADSDFGSPTQMCFFIRTGGNQS